MPLEPLAIAEAAKTIIQVALGGVLGTVIALAVTWVRERRKTRDEDLATLRLIEFEVGNARRGARAILEEDAPYTAFPITAWEEGRIRLARMLEPEQWMLVAAAYDAIHGFNWRYQHDKDHPDDQVLLNPADRNPVVSKMVAAADEARAALDAYA